MLVAPVRGGVWCGVAVVQSCNTRYEWLARPFATLRAGSYSAGTCTLQETPSLLGALTARASAACIWANDD